MEHKDATGHGAGFYHELLSTPSVAVLRRKPSVATTTGSVRDLAPTPARVSTATNPASTSGAPQQHHQLPAARTYHTPRAAPQTVSNHVTHLQQTGITPLVEQVEHIIEAVQPALPPTITMGDFTWAVVVATVSALRHQGYQGSTLRLWTPVLERSATMVQVADMAGTTGPTGVGSSARVCCSRARPSMR